MPAATDGQIKHPDQTSCQTVAYPVIWYNPLNGDSETIGQHREGAAQNCPLPHCRA